MEHLHGMTRFISSVAELTDLRDRDRLEVSVATVLFDLLGPGALTLFRVVQHDGALRLRERAHMTSHSRVATSDAFTEPGHLPRLDERIHLAACHERKEIVSVTHDDGSHTSVFPVQSDIGNIGLLELRSDRPLTLYQHRLIGGLLRIYRNYIRVLDAGLYDQLTGLLNRRIFDEHLLALLEAQRDSTLANRPSPGTERRAAVTDAPCWLAVLDIDHFKRINDTFGHLYGDEVLVLLARLLGTIFRDCDRIFRFGGEEFVVVLSAVPATSVEEVLERCRATVEAFAFPQVGRVTISVGYTAIRADDAGSSAFGRADKALYAAKERGRNQVRNFEALVAQGYVEQGQRVATPIELFR